MENIISGLSVSLIGIGTVMIILLFISVLLNFLQLFGDKKPKKEPQTILPPTKLVPTQPETNILMGNEELIAVIAAAVAQASNTPTDSFVVRSIARVPAWKQALRRDQQTRL